MGMVTDQVEWIGAFSLKAKGTVWVIGASSGLGLATAQAFAKEGWLVIAGARSFATPQNDEKEAASKGMHSLFLDVTDDESCDHFTQKALAISDRVDVLCYGAGLLILGACEETSAAEYQQVLATNFIGMTRMVQRVLPLMREQRKGKIILFSSINGVLGIPFQSAYTASKHAIEGYAECLAMETRPFNLSVCLIQPGDHRGGSASYRLKAEQSQKESPYRQAYANSCQRIHSDEANGLSPEALGRKLAQLANKRHLPFRLRIAKLDQRAACWLHALLSPKLLFRLLSAYYIKSAYKTKD